MVFWDSIVRRRRETTADLVGNPNVVPEWQPPVIHYSWFDEVPTVRTNWKLLTIQCHSDFVSI